MAQSLRLDTGVQEYDINGRAIFRINPADPNLFENILGFEPLLKNYEERFQALKLKMYREALEQAEAKANRGDEDEGDIETDEQGFPKTAPEIVREMKALDAEIKEKLREVFGPENDFDAIFDHKSALALTNSGANILENFLEMITPLITTGSAERTDKMQKILDARKEAQMNRAQRRAAAKAEKKGGNG